MGGDATCASLWDPTWPAWVLVAQAPAQSSVWGHFIWGQIHSLSQLGPVLLPASGQRAAFISQLQRVSPRAAGHHPHSPQHLHLWEKANCACRVAQPSGHSHGRSACAADAAGCLVGVCAPRSVRCHTRAKSCKCGCQVSTWGCAQCLSSLAAPSPCRHSCSSQCSLGRVGWAGRHPTKMPGTKFSFASSTAFSLSQ